MMDILIKNATVIVGDGETVIENASISINHGKIVALSPRDETTFSDLEFSEVIDATDCFVFPGLINAHSHCGSLGPKFSSAALPPTMEEIRGNIDRHMLQGTTTLLNLSGFGTMEETENINKNHPVRILTGTCHFPSCFKAAQMVDGAGLQKEHFALSAKKMVKLGAVALGEIGSGATLGGGVTDYKYIPEAVKELTGITITAQYANDLKTLFLPDGIHIVEREDTEITKLLSTMGLKDKLTPRQAKEMVIEIAFKPLKAALDGFDEACAVGATTGIPVLCHTALPSVEKIIQMLEKYANTKLLLVSGHCNHPSFSVEEAVKYATHIKKLGGIVDVSSLDAIVTQWMNFPERIEALVSAGLVDTFSTDYGGGHWDSVLEMIHYLHKKKILSIPTGIAMATRNVAKIYGRTTAGLGLISPGKIADVVIADQKNISRVFKVIINGVTVADKGGRILNPRLPS